MARLSIWAGLPIVLCLLAACGPNTHFEELTIIPDGKWDVNNKSTYEFSISDVSQPYNLYVKLNNTMDYGYANIYLFSEVKYPSGEVQRDTLHCLLADKGGKWLGNPSGDQVENQIIFRQNAYFNTTGSYTISFEQAMRHEVLENITAVGLRVETVR